ncbi:MAG: mandelate racemase/muconate lactonizing enzyme family protein [Pseudomonadota bacterium]|nr:mandelate racemase/muconate lactonizing enzyme family protein [Pseudomonadota bacterium]
MSHSESIHIAKLAVFALTAKVARGPMSSLGPMPVRRALLLRLEDAEGAHGWGEVWCNFPPHGAESRAHLLEDAFRPLVVGAEFSTWDALRPALSAQLERIMIHTGEAGAFLHCMAGLDMAMADLAARRVGLPMASFLGGQVARVAVYASTPSGVDIARQCEELAAAGHTAIKLKIGYAAQADRGLVRTCRQALGPRVSLMADANQAWSAAQALAQIEGLAPFGLEFVEEPMRADEPVAVWQRLASVSPVPLAAGENIASHAAFATLIDQRGLHVVQPDVAKWGGMSGTMAIGRYALDHGARCCFHFMGSALGLAASLHGLAALGGDGRVELDANENPLRTALGDIDLRVVDGRLSLPPGPGFGFEPNARSLREFAS